MTRAILPRRHTEPFFERRSKIARFAIADERRDLANIFLIFQKQSRARLEPFGDHILMQRLTIDR